MEEIYKKYKRKEVAELRPITKEDVKHYEDNGFVKYGDNGKVSISEADLRNGSPKIGDMVARNPKDHGDQWLVAKKYFQDNFTEVEDLKKSIGFKNKESLLICGFPGVGKSYLTKEFGSVVSDSDSSTFDKKDFPSNYIKHINSLIGKKKVICISTHKEVLDEVEKLGVNFLIIHPERSLKNEYLERYKERGSPEEFVKMMGEKWDSFMDAIEQPRENSWRIVLKKGEFLGNYFN